MVIEATERVHFNSNPNGHGSAFRTRPDNGSPCLRIQQKGPEVKCGHRQRKSEEECVIQFAITLIQGKWKIRILSRLQHGPARLSQLHRMLPLASRKMLTQHLRQMERDCLIVRRDLSGKLRHVEYSLSDPLGFAALQLIKTLEQWVSHYAPSSLLKDECKTSRAN
jgi:DNA-binding HxlR family transcriptional regulator